jgi:DNA polymerase III delta prime subunit
MQSSAQHAIRDSLKVTMSKWIPTTGSPITDTLVSTMIFVLINAWFLGLIERMEGLKAVLVRWLSSITSWFGSDAANVVLVGHNSRCSKYGGSNLSYSDRFLAVSDYVQRRIPELKDVVSLKENRVKERGVECYREAHALIIDQLSVVPLTDEIGVLYEIETNDTDSDEKKKQLGSTVTITTITLSSKTLVVHEIASFIDDVTRDFVKKQELESLDKQLYFEFEALDDEGRPVFLEKRFASHKHFDTVFFPGKEKLISQYEYFLDNEKWYNDKGIPWHFGVLLSGPPGSGKTSTIKALVNHRSWRRAPGDSGQLDHVVSVPLPRVHDCTTLSKIFHNEKINRHVIPMSSRVYLFEDVDAQPSCTIRGDISTKTGDVSSGSSTFEEIEKTEVSNATLMGYMQKEVQKAEAVSAATLIAASNPDPLTLAHILNLLDGLIECPGQRRFFTTNRKHRLDPALIRPGRVDADIELGYATCRTIADMYQRFYDRETLSDELVGELADEKVTPAEVNNVLFMHAHDGDAGLAALLELSRAANRLEN